MAEVAAATAADDLGATHEQAAILMLGDAFGSERGGEAGPATAGIEFGRRLEQRFAAADAAIGAGILAVPVFAAEGALGAFLAGDVVLHGRELRAPFGFGLADPGFAAHGDLRDADYNLRHGEWDQLWHN